MSSRDWRVNCGLRSADRRGRRAGAPGECSVWGARRTDGRWCRKASGRRCAVRAHPPWTLPAVSQMGAAPNPRTLTGRSGASSHVLRFPLRAFLRFPGCPPGSSPSSAFLWFPFVRRSLVRSLRPLPGSGSPSVSRRVPFPLGNLHVSPAVGRFRRRRSQAAGTKVTSSASTTSPGSRDPPALQMGSGCARWDAATESPVKDTAPSGRVSLCARAMRASALSGRRMTETRGHEVRSERGSALAIGGRRRRGGGNAGRERRWRSINRTVVAAASSTIAGAIASAAAASARRSGAGLRPGAGAGDQVTMTDSHHPALRMAPSSRRQCPRENCTCRSCQRLWPLRAAG